MAFEIPLDIAYFGHPKTLKLISILGRVEADVYPLRLWAWAAQYARDGHLPSDCRVIERGLGWRGASGRLVSALVQAGYLAASDQSVVGDREAGDHQVTTDRAVGDHQQPTRSQVWGYVIHDWDQHTGRAIAIYDAKKRKQRERYEKSSGILPEDHRKNSPNPGCPIQDVREEIRESAQKPLPEPPSSPIGMLLTKAEKNGIIGREDTKRTYFNGWIKRNDYTRAEQIVEDPWSAGKTLIEIQDHFFPKASAAKDQSFTPAKTKCGNCGGTGRVAGGVKDGAVIQVPCSRCQKLRAVQ